MSQPYAMQSIEARVFRAWWDDGQLDLFLGVGTLGVATFWAVDLVALGAVVPGFLAVLWTPIRKALIEPRAGWVEFCTPRLAGSRRKLLAILAAGVGTLVAFAIAVYLESAGIVELAADFSAAIPGVLMGLMGLIVAVGLRIGRFLWYAGVFVVAAMALAPAGYEPEVAMAAAGAIVTASGVSLLARFFWRSRLAEVGR